MNSEKPKLPKPNAVKELRELYNKRKEERLKKYDDFAEKIKNQSPKKKIV